MLRARWEAHPANASPTRKKRKTFCDRPFPPSPTKPVGISQPGSSSAAGVLCAAMPFTQFSSTSDCAATWLAIIAMLNRAPNAQSDCQHGTASGSLNSSLPVLEFKLLTSQAAPRNSTSTFVTWFEPHATSTSTSSTAAISQFSMNPGKPTRLNSLRSRGSKSWLRCPATKPTMSNNSAVVAFMIEASRRSCG